MDLPDDLALAARYRWAISISEEVGHLLRSRFGTGISHQTKDRGIVTDLDRQAEELVATSLHEAFPDDGLVGEEGTERPGTSGWRWVVDPLDGTTNFVAGLPNFAVSLACLPEGDRHAELGVVHAPFFQGSSVAYREPGRRPTPPGDGDLSTAVFILNKAYAPAATLWGVAGGLLNEIRAFRTFGCVSLDLAFVSDGRADGLVLLPADAWDVAAGLLLLEEAGMATADLDGRPDPDGRRGIIATRPELLAPALAALDPTKL